MGSMGRIGLLQCCCLPKRDRHLRPRCTNRSIVSTGTTSFQNHSSRPTPPSTCRQETEEQEQCIVYRWYSSLHYIGHNYSLTFLLPDIALRYRRTIQQDKRHSKHWSLWSENLERRNTHHHTPQTTDRIDFICGDRNQEDLRDTLVMQYLPPSTHLAESHSGSLTK